MPSIVRDTTGVQQRGFTPYEGSEPVKGFYRAKIKKVSLQKAKSSDSLMFAVVAEFEASASRPNAAQYDGYPAFMYLTLGDHDALKEREQAFYLTVSGKEKANIKTEGDANKLKRGESTKVTSINGKDPVGSYGLVEMRLEEDKREGHEGEQSMRADAIYPTRDQIAGKQVAGQSSAVADEDDEDLDEDEDGNAVDEYTEEDLKGKSLAELRRILSEEFEVDPSGIKGKANLVGEILDAQADLRDDDEDEDLDEEEDDEDLEDDEDEDEDEDQEAEIREEIQAMSRRDVQAGLKKYDVHKDRKFKKSETDEDLREELIQMRLQDPPF
jgi:hypothetical protein